MAKSVNARRHPAVAARFEFFYSIELYFYILLSSAKSIKLQSRLYCCVDYKVNFGYFTEDFL